MLVLHLKTQLPEEKVANLAGRFLGGDAYDTLIEADADVYRPDGQVLLKFRRKVLPLAPCAAAYQQLRRLGFQGGNRGYAEELERAKNRRAGDPIYD